ncbi:MAG: precorrin-2 C(20)-methyltransferase [Deltaproteobacteria bacterium]|jgi:precorrin-2/cobalt-factor-2 C20-methyltransferase|nr:precorrin-2 C(20)-methyltransferase [Deltaproteobacteria bacterium]
MTDKLGSFYGLGVGPGDPELLTLKAVRILNQVDVVFTAASSKNEYSLARDIASPHLKPGAEVETLNFPMTADEAQLDAAWAANAESVAKVLRSGRSAAFLTLGDCLTYSTYSYLLPFLKKIIPEAPIVSVPGITSYQLAAARLNRPLCLNSESFTVLSGTGDEENFSALMDKSDNLAIMKSYRGREKVIGMIKEKKLAANTALCSQLGLPNEKVTDGLDDDFPDDPSYFTIFLVTKRGRD